jgi:hypothetical protein
MAMNEPRVRFRSSRLAGETAPNLDHVDLTLTGAPIDERGRSAVAALTPMSSAVSQLEFLPDQQRLMVDGLAVSRIGFQQSLKGKRVRLETTTLGLAEVLRTLQALDAAHTPRCEFVYVEPGEYTRNALDLPGAEGTPAFALSRNCDFQTVLGFAAPYEDNAAAVHVYFMGYEQGRLLRAIEQRENVDPKRYRREFVVGVPAFELGWENNVFGAHSSYMEKIGVRSDTLSYCPANSVQDAYSLLWTVYGRFRNEEITFFVSPLGTKPHGLATALFLLETRDGAVPTSLYYDHPVRVPERSRRIAAWHTVAAAW